jgi:hypothetical protein
MEDQQGYVGEENAAREQRQRHDRLSAEIGGLGFLIGIVIQALISIAVDKSIAILGGMRAWIIAGLTGVALFGAVKIYLFFKACCRDTVFSKWRCFKITISHYRKCIFAHPHLLISVVCYSSVLGSFFWILSYKNARSFPVCIFIIAVFALTLVAGILYRLILRFARISQSDLGQVLLKKTHPSIRWETSGEINPNRKITEILLNLQGVDLICISAVHFSHLMRSQERLKTIRDNNPNADIYFMPQFPYSWHILERAAELEYFYRRAYLAPLVHGIFNACKHLKTHVMLRHNPAEFRLTIWVKYNKNNRSNTIRIPEAGILPAQIENGGFFAQQYIHGQEGYESPYLNVSKEEWSGALTYLTNWFFENWRNNCSPIRMEDVVSNEQYMLRVAKDIGLSQRKINHLRGSGNLRHYLENNDNLKELYLAIENGEI